MNTLGMLTGHVHAQSCTLLLLIFHVARSQNYYENKEL